MKFRMCREKNVLLTESSQGLSASQNLVSVAQLKFLVKVIECNVIVFHLHGDQNLVFFLLKDLVQTQGTDNALDGEISVVQGAWLWFRVVVIVQLNAEVLEYASGFPFVGGEITCELDEMGKTMLFSDDVGLLLHDKAHGHAAHHEKRLPLGQSLG